MIGRLIPEERTRVSDAPVDPLPAARQPVVTDDPPQAQHALALKAFTGRVVDAGEFFFALRHSTYRAI